MKDSIVIEVDAQDCRCSSHKIVLTRQQLEAALKALNAPEQLRGGDWVYHVNIDKTRDTFIVLSSQYMAGPNETRVVNIGTGMIYTYTTSNLKRFGE